jgi:8-oxo-dGTP pyrophosphatase MutT (NUDIX family)
VADHEQRPAIPAATVIVLRDAADGLETLLARRNADLSFVGGYWVFPGGRVDEADRVAGGSQDELAVARRAAVREVAEEVGLVVAEPSLVALSHWLPPEQAPKRFATWFFLAPLEGASADVVIDDGEITDSLWCSPQEALRRQAAGEIDMAPPTWVSLWWLTRCGDVGDALARAAAVEPERFASRYVDTEDGIVLLQPGDAGYDDLDLHRAGPRHRFLMHRSGWRYERDLD